MGTFATGAWITFALLSTVIVAFSIMMLFSRNFVHSTAYLAATLMAFAGIYALLDATFLALLQVFIYAGAITVVVAFVVMMTRTGVGTMKDLLQPQLPGVAAVVALLAVGLFTVLVGAAPFLGALKPIATTEQIAVALMGKYAAAFEISSLILLAALIGAIYLAKEADR